MFESSIVLPPLPAGSELPLVSIIVPTYKRERLLCITLQSLLGQTYPRMEIIVVDQTETHEERTLRFLEQHAGALRVIRSAPPAVTRARSAGARAARGDIVLYVDDDVYCCRDLVSGHVRAQMLPGVGIVAGRITENVHVQPVDDQVGRLDTHAGVTRYFNSQIRQYVDHAPGANMSFKREPLLRAGLFEPKMGRTARYEETDACVRVVRLGYKVVFEPTAHLHHFGGAGGQSYGIGFEGWYRTVIHNGLLMVLRNFKVRYWPSAFSYWLRNAYYLSRRDRTMLPVRIFFSEAPRSMISFFQSTRSLPRNAPRWPLN